VSRDGRTKQETSVWAVILKEALVKLQGPSAEEEEEEGNPFPQPGLEPRTVQSLVRHYTEYVISPSGALSRKNQIMR
jgi:hypothetical protein